MKPPYLVTACGLVLEGWDGKGGVEGGGMGGRGRERWLMGEREGT